jgi:hypothetical protein
MNKKRTLAIIEYLFVFSFLAGFAASCGEKGLNFGDHNSPDAWRTALLQQVPVGSSREEVVDFLMGKGFRQGSDEVDYRIDCGCYESFKASLLLKICDDWWSSDGYWLIEFQLDQKDKVREIWVDILP